jgi:SAM-dependent methyltransferase
MSELSSQNPTGRFTGLAGVYARHRPSYPAAALDFIVQRCRLGPASVLVDVGSGTGISARMFAQLGVSVIGIEPNDEMRHQAERELLPAGMPAPVYRAGRAEATGLRDGSADAVLSAQAFHWFDPEPTLREFHRILKPGGWVALLWHERDEADAFTAAYGKIVRSTPEAAATEGSRQRAGETLLVSPIFAPGERVVFTHEQALDEEGVVGRAMSVSYAPKEPGAVEVYRASLREVFARFQHAGQVVMRYETTVFVAQRREME